MNIASRILTDRQREVLDFIIETYNRTGISPTIREIQEHFKLASPFGVQRHLAAFVSKGLIDKAPHKARYRVAPNMNYLHPRSDRHAPRGEQLSFSLTAA